MEAMLYSLRMLTMTSNYSHIRRTNLLLKNAESYATPSDIAQYVGEAKFFRAYSYFDLLQLYGNAILVKEPMEVTDARNVCQAE